MGTSKKDKENIKKLMKQNEAFNKQLEALGITIDNLDEKIDSLPEDQYSQVNENYKKISEGGIITTEPTTPPPVVEPPVVDCGPKAHWDAELGKCVDDIVVPPPVEPPTPTTGDKDKFGIPYFHKSKVGGLNYEMSDDPKNDQTMDELDEHYTVRW